MAREARGIEVTIVSSDKDLMQLVGDGVGMLDPMKGRPIGHDEVVEKFGVGRRRWSRCRRLAGDSSDNVPGVPGIGVKTAAQLIEEYGDLETLLARAAEIKAAQAPREPDRKSPRWRGSAGEAGDTAGATCRWTTRLEDFALRQPDPEVLRPFLERERLQVDPGATGQRLGR